MNDFKEYEKTIEKLEETIEKSNLKEEDKKELQNLVEEIEDKFNRYDSYIAFNFDVYEKEKEILLNHFIEKDDEVNQVYRELNGFKRTIFYKSYAFARKIYHVLFKRNRAGGKE